VVDTTRYYAHTDAAGNVMALTAGNGSLARSYWYDTWGQLTGGTDYVALNGTDMARFKGALHFQLNGVELHYMRNRLYEPRTGRFLSEDPIGLDGGINLYTFAGNDPVNGTDPTGLKCEWRNQSYWFVNAEGQIQIGTRRVLDCLGDRAHGESRNGVTWGEQGDGAQGAASGSGGGACVVGGAGRGVALGFLNGAIRGALVGLVRGQALALRVGVMAGVGGAVILPVGAATGFLAGYVTTTAAVTASTALIYGAKGVVTGAGLGAVAGAVAPELACPRPLN
jgi:RHS repeat-associated protein